MENERSPAAHKNDVGTLPEHDAGGTKESFEFTLNPVSMSLPSVTQPNPSLKYSSCRDAVTPPLYRDVAAATVRAADLRGVSTFTGEPDQNVLENLGHFRVIVVLEAKRVRPND